MLFLNYDKKNRVVVVTLNRPERLNALRNPLLQELAEAWTKFRYDPYARVAIITGIGRAFWQEGISKSDLGQGVLRGLP